MDEEHTDRLGSSQERSVAVSLIEPMIEIDAVCATVSQSLSHDSDLGPTSAKWRIILGALRAVLNFLFASTTET
jgi:hypothetical protein